MMSKDQSHGYRVVTDNDIFGKRICENEASE